MIQRLILICFFCISLPVYSQSSSLKIQLTQIDQIKNDSIAFEMLKVLATRKPEDDKTLLDLNYRLVVRAHATRNYGIAIRLTNESIVVAQENKLDSMEAYFTKLLGITYYFIDQRLEALPYFKRSAEIAKKNGYWQLESSCYNNIGAILSEKLQFALAEEFLLRSISIMREHGAEEHEQTLRTYRILASLYNQSHQPGKAEAIYLVLIDKARNTKDTTLLASSLIYYSDILRGRKDFDNAFKFGEEALSLARKQNDPKMLQLVYSFHGQTLAMTNRYKEAYELQKQASILTRAVFANDLEKEVSNMQVFYETEQIKKDKKSTEEKARRQTIIYVISLVAIMVIISLSVFIWNQQKNARQKSLLQQQRLETLIEGEEKERSRIARDLHDGIVQDLTAVKLNIQKENDFHSREGLLKELDKAIADVRNIAYQMMPVALKEYGLVSALEDLVRKMMIPTGIQFEFEAIDISNEHGELSSSERFPEKIELCLYRVAQELLNNVVKHSQANFITVTLTKHPDKITLFCEDNGLGFDENTIQKGIGMNGLRARLSFVNGTISFQSSGEKGTMVITSIPIQ